MDVGLGQVLLLIARLGPLEVKKKEPPRAFRHTGGRKCDQNSVARRVAGWKLYCTAFRTPYAARIFSLAGVDPQFFICFASRRGKAKPG